MELHFALYFYLRQTSRVEVELELYGFLLELYGCLVGTLRLFSRNFMVFLLELYGRLVGTLRLFWCIFSQLEFSK